MGTVGVGSQGFDLCGNPLLSGGRPRNPKPYTLPLGHRTLCVQRRGLDNFEQDSAVCHAYCCNYTRTTRDATTNLLDPCIREPCAVPAAGPTRVRATDSQRSAKH